MGLAIWLVTAWAAFAILPWQGGRTNRVTEEFAIRLQQETGCMLADREHGRVIEWAGESLVAEWGNGMLPPIDQWLNEF